MRHGFALRWLIALIAALALVAAGAGLFWQGKGEPFQFTTARGETVTLQGHGLYRNDTMSSVAQEQANDLVTLVVGLPLLVGAAWLALRGSLRGRLLLAGTLGFFLYTYMSMAFLAAYNELFLVYVVLFALSLYAFVLCLLSFDLYDLPRHFAPSLPRRSVAAVLFVGGSFLLLAWLGRIVPPLLAGRAPALDNATTLVIQAMDLALIVPLCFLAGVLLLRRSAWGYLLASVAVMKFNTMGLAVSTMALNMARLGMPVSAVELGVFPAITLANLVVTALVLHAITPIELRRRPIHTPAASRR